MTKRHLFKTSILAGLAAVCPVVASSVTQNIDVCQWESYVILSPPIDGIASGRLTKLEDFVLDAESQKEMNKQGASFCLWSSDGGYRKISREQFKQLFNI